MLRKREYEFVSEEAGRLDAVASKALNIPRTCFSLSSMVILLNGKSTKKSQKLKEGDKVQLSYEEEVLEGLEAEDIPLDVIYEDDQILVINKAQGMSVHPGAGTFNGTVANALLGMYGEDFETGDDSLRPGIVHRLDKDTSGIMIIAKTQEAHAGLSAQFAEHSNEKYYLAIAKGFFPQTEDVIERRLVRDRNNRKRYTVTDNKSEGKDALTRYHVLSQNENYALVRVRIYTGRTHQIRVHLQSIGHPVVGDPIYGRKDNRYPEATLMLHSQRLVIKHPTTGEKLVFRTPIPERFEELLKRENLSVDEI